MKRNDTCCKCHKPSFWRLGRCFAPSVVHRKNFFATHSRFKVSGCKRAFFLKINLFLTTWGTNHTLENSGHVLFYSNLHWKLHWWLWTHRASFQNGVGHFGKFGLKFDRIAFKCGFAAQIERKSEILYVVLTFVWRVETCCKCCKRCVCRLVTCFAPSVGHR